MALSDIERLMRMDEQILDLEYLYTKELMREKELGKHNLLLSRGFKYRIENLRRAKAKFKQSMSGRANSIQVNFTLTLASKRAELEDVEKELTYLNKQYKDIMVRVLVGKDENLASETLELAKEIKIQERRVRTKERAISNWLERGSLIAERKPPSREYKNYNVESDPEIMDSLNSNPNSNPNFNRIEFKQEKIPESNASLDLLRRPGE